MNFLSRQVKRFGKRPLTIAAALLILALGAAGAPALADPASTLQTLMIVDEGDFLNFQWSFYYVDFPSKFALKEKQSKTVSLDNPATLYDNISDIISVAFDLRIDGHPVRPEKISRLTISPNKVCNVILIYRGRPGARVELRAPVLQYLPPTAMINYEIVSLGHPGNVITGNLMAHQGPFPQVIDYREIGRSGPAAPEETAFFALFKSQLRTAWINSNWLLMSVILLVVYEPKKACVPLAMMTAGWIALGLLDGAVNLRFPWPLPEWLLSLPTVLLGVIAATRPQKWFWIVLSACGAGLLDAAYDLQQIRWAPGDRTSSALGGLCLGFVCSMFSLVLVLGILLQEGRKYREFQTVWASRICWLAAALALALPLQRSFFR